MEPGPTVNQRFKWTTRSPQVTQGHITSFDHHVHSGQNGSIQAMGEDSG